MSTRPDRVAEEVRAALSQALLTSVSDPRLSRVSVTAVTLTRDLRHGRVYWNLVDPEQAPADIAAAEAGLARAAAFLRRSVAESVRLRFTPELVFAYDESIDRGRAMDALLARIHKSEEP